MNGIRKQYARKTRDNSRAAFQNVKAEEYVIGSMFHRSDYIDDISTLVSAEMFFDEELGEVFSILVDMNDARQGIDLHLVQSELKRQEVDFPVHRLAKILKDVPHAYHFKFYGQQVVEAYQRRKCTEVASELIQNCQDLKTSVERSVSATINKLESTSFNQEQHVVTLSEAAEAFLEDIKKPKAKRLCMSGLHKLDETIGGMRAGEMIVIAARPGCGKTSLAMQIARHNTMRGRGVLFVSLEMTFTELVARTVVGLTDVSSSAIRQRSLSPDQISQIQNALDCIKDEPLTIADQPAASLRQIRGNAKLVANRGELSMVVIDYLSLVAGEPGQDTYTKVSENSQGIKRLAKELGVPVIALCQLNREADGSKPRLRHLRESGAIEQDADMVIFLHRPESETTKSTQENLLIVAKNRHGRTGETSIFFEADKTRFADGVAWQP